MDAVGRKLIWLHELLDEHGLDALLLRTVASFAWATDGAASHVHLAASEGEASLLITRDARYLITNNIEAPRLEQEEKLDEQGWRFEVSPWFRPADTVARLTAGLKLGADGPLPNAVDLSAPLSRLRARLLPAEQERFRELGRSCAEAMDEAIRAIRPGMSEHQIAAQLAAAASKRGVQPTVNLVATDDRVYRFRHPLPTDKRLAQYAMLVLCGRQHGLVCSITRLVHFGPLPDDLRARARAVAAVDAAFILATRPERSLNAILQAGADAYQAAGYPDEWQRHHQGGPAGYLPREYVATPTTTDPVSTGQAYAWNPSIAGVKSEDTVLIGETANEILTEIPGWPTLSVEVYETPVLRPAILEID